MGELQKLPNIAEKLEVQLVQVGVSTVAELKAAGSRDTWLRIAAIDPSACYMRLCALEGAIRGIRWHHLDDQTKSELKAFYERHKK